MKRRCSLKQTEVQNIIETGKIVKKQNIIVYFEHTVPNTGRYTVGLSKKIKPIVKKNRVRRQIKAIMDKHKAQWSDYNLLLIAKESYLSLTFQENELKIVETLQKILSFKNDNKK